MKKRENKNSITAILEEVRALYAARQGKKDAARRETEELSSDIARLTADRAAALDRQDVAAVMEIDEQEHRLSVQKEVAAHFLRHTPPESPDTIRGFVDSLNQAVDKSDAEALAVFVSARDQARTAYNALMRDRKQVIQAMEMLRRMAPPDLSWMCRMAPNAPDVPIVGTRLAGVMIPSVDKDERPGAWKLYEDT